MSSPTSPDRIRRISLLRFLWGRQDPLKLLDSLRDEPSRLDHARLGRKHLVLLKHPDQVQQVLVADGAKVTKGRTLERARFFRFLGDGLLNAEGDAHRRQRRLVLPAFHRARLAGYGDIMTGAARGMADPWTDGEVRDLGTDMMAFTLDVVGRTLFSSEKQDTTRIIATAFDQLSTNINRLMFPGALWLLHLPLPFVRRLQSAQETLDTVVTDLVRQRRADGRDTGDLISMLLLAEDAEHPGEKLSDQEVRDQVMTLFFAGHETTANALTWTWWLLARHPEIETALHRELDRVLAGRTPTFADMPNLVYTEQIIREVLRLYPPVWAMGRQVVQAVDFGGFSAPPGSLILASQWLIHRDARWYADPLTFNPARWTPEFRAALPRFAYFPFGGGARSCMGENFAWMEFILTLATLAQKWRFELAPESRDVVPLARITLHPDRPVKVRLVRR